MNLGSQIFLNKWAIDLRMMIGTWFSYSSHVNSTRFNKILNKSRFMIHQQKRECSKIQFIFNISRWSPLWTQINQPCTQADSFRSNSMEDSLTQNEVVSRFGINLTPMVRFQDTAQSMLCGCGKNLTTSWPCNLLFQHRACYWAIWWLVECLLPSMSLKIVT